MAKCVSTCARIDGLYSSTSPAKMSASIEESAAVKPEAVAPDDNRTMQLSVVPREFLWRGQSFNSLIGRRKGGEMSISVELGVGVLAAFWPLKSNSPMERYRL